jgi:hypothetical protein
MPKSQYPYCLGCRQKKEYIEDQYCQRCEGRKDGEYYAGNVRHEVLFQSKRLNLSPICSRMIRHKVACINRWREAAMRYIDIKEFNVFYQSFMREFARLTADIRGEEEAEKGAQI